MLARHDGRMRAQPHAFSVVVPVFREAGNIPALVERVHRALSEHGLEWELILVDDDSRDGSAPLVDALSRRLPVRMVTRRGQPRDLSRSVLLGFECARFDRLVVMDGDLSHPPEAIVDLLAALDTSVDMVIGSRYAPGGRIDRAWSLRRRLISRAATLLARPLVRCADPLSGFFAMHRSALPDPRTLRPLGYKIALEIMVRGRLRVREVPIVFQNRSVGSSKLGWRQARGFVRQLGHLYVHLASRAVRDPSST